LAGVGQEELDGNRTGVGGLPVNWDEISAHFLYFYDDEGVRISETWTNGRENED